MAKETEFIDDFSNAFANTQSRPLINETKPVVETPKAHAETSSNKVTTKAPEKTKIKPSLKKQGDTKSIRVYMTSSLHKKIIKSVLNKAIKDGGRISVSSHVMDILEREFAK